VGEPVAEVFGALAQAAVASADKQHLGRRKGVVSRLRITIITHIRACSHLAFAALRRAAEAYANHSWRKASRCFIDQPYCFVDESDVACYRALISSFFTKVRINRMNHNL
jgi:hypothetical protein